MPHTAMEEQPQRADIRGPRTGEGFPTMEKLGTVVEKNPAWNTTVLVVKLDPSSPGMGKNKCFKTSSMKNNIFSFDQFRICLKELWSNATQKEAKGSK